VNNEERRLADVLHRITPEPPRPVTVEQVAYRLVSEPKLGHQSRGRQSRGRAPRPRRGGLSLSRAWAPVLAAAAVVVVAGASVGIAVLANSHHTPPTSAGGTPASSSVSSPPVSASQTASSTQGTTPTTDLAGGPWSAALIDHQAFAQGSLVSGDSSLYAYSNGSLDRIDPGTGAIAATAPYKAPLFSPPVIVGDTVWVVWSSSGGNVILHGYNAQTLAQTASVLVPATGPVSTVATNILTSAPDGDLYVAAGDTVVVVNPDNGQPVQHFFLPSGQANSVAVAPDGSTLYVGTGSSTSFKLLVYNLASGTVVNESTLTSGAAGGDLVATSGGVWGTTGSGHSEWTWFAPGGDLTRAVQVGQGAGGGWDSYPSYSGGTVWVGGDGDLVCASPATGQVLAKAAIPADHNVAQYFGSPVVYGGQAYAQYQTDASPLVGVARLTPPAACSGLSS
jgi:sugar lactone lactonase YvrE